VGEKRRIFSFFLTYIHGPKGEALHLPIESSILGSLHSFNSFLLWANQIGSLQKKRKKKRSKVGLVRHPGKRVYEADPNPLTPKEDDHHHHRTERQTPKILYN